MMMMFSQKLTQKPSTTGSYRLLLLVLMAGLAAAMALSMVFAGDAEAKKKKKKKKSPARSALVAPGTTFPPPGDVYSGEHVVRAWGWNHDGQLGNGTNTDSNTPVQVQNLSGVKTVASGWHHSLTLKEDGTVWAWGYNEFGQLGDGSTTDRNTPVRVKGELPTLTPASSSSSSAAFLPLTDFSGVKAIAAGGWHSLALKEDGTVWAWGENDEGQLGNGTNTDSYTPVQVQNLSGVKAIAGGGRHSLALKEDGTVWAWGYNGFGQLGDGTITNRNTPVRVKGELPTLTPASSSAAFLPWTNLSGVKAIAAGEWYSLAVMEDGTVQAWGDNDEGQLGDGTTTRRYTPVRVSGLSGVKAIDGGYDHTLALKEDGTVFAWGHNYHGQLGDGTTTRRNTPAQVRNLSGVKAIAAGGRHGLALKSDGTVFAWGSNYYGELGDGTSGTDRNTPVLVKNLSGVQDISAGGSHSLAKAVNPPVLAPQ